MSGAELQLSNLVVILAVVLVVVGLVFAVFWYFKRASDLCEEDRLNIERSSLSWIGAVALGVLALVLMRKEKHMKGRRAGSSASAASTLL